MVIIWTIGLGDLEISSSLQDSVILDLKLPPTERVVQGVVEPSSSWLWQMAKHGTTSTNCLFPNEVMVQRVKLPQNLQGLCL